MTNTNSMIEINNRSFLMGQKLCLIWRFLLGQRREYENFDQSNKYIAP